MSSFRFIHCSDLHIDSPFKGLSSLHPEWGQKLRQSTLQAFQNVVDLAIRQKVDAVIIAGDIYDSADRSLQAQLKFRGKLKQLADAGIPSFIVHGNHDPLDGWSSSLNWPDAVTIFSGDRVESIPVKKNGATLAHIYGISFPTREVTENLALQFTREPHSGFAVGVLHANVGGHSDHDPYAPCTIQELASRGMDYWALGHIHMHEILQARDPAIVYSGNTQSKSINETGPKGCCLVTLEEDSAPDIQFFATDSVRHEVDCLDLSEAASLDDALQSIRSHLEHMSTQTDSRDLVVRLTLSGRSEIHAELNANGNIEALSEEIQNHFESHTPRVWAELILKTQGTYDIDSLRQGKDFIADILAIYEEAEAGAKAQLMDSALKPLFQDWQGKKYLEPLSGEERVELIRKARDLTLDRLIDG